jgi:hypothetical protein
MTNKININFSLISSLFHAKFHSDKPRKHFWKRFAAKTDLRSVTYDVLSEWKRLMFAQIHQLVESCHWINTLGFLDEMMLHILIALSSLVFLPKLSLLVKSFHFHYQYNIPNDLFDLRTLWWQLLQFLTGTKTQIILWRNQKIPKLSMRTKLAIEHEWEAKFESGRVESGKKLET